MDDEESESATSFGNDDGFGLRELMIMLAMGCMLTWGGLECAKFS